MTATLVQSITKQYTNASSVQQAMGTCTNGTYIIACLTMENSTTTATCSDTANGSYTPDGYSENGSPAHPSSKGRVYIFRVANTSTGTPTVTCTLSGNNYGQLQLYEVSGLATSSVVDVVSELSFASGWYSPASTPLSITTSAANDAVFAFLCGDTTGTADTGYTQAYAAVGQFNAYSFGEADNDVGAAGAQSIAFGIADFNAHAFAAVLIAYKLPSAASTFVPAAMVSAQRTFSPGR